MAIQDSMKPKDVGAPQMIPQGNLSDSPGSFAGLRKALDDAQKHKTVSRTSANPEFAPGYDTAGIEGDWQCTTVK